MFLLLDSHTRVCCLLANLHGLLRMRGALFAVAVRERRQHVGADAPRLLVVVHQRIRWRMVPLAACIDFARASSLQRDVRRDCVRNFTASIQLALNPAPGNVFILRAMRVLQRDVLAIWIAFTNGDIALCGALERRLRLHFAANVARRVGVLLLLQ